MIFLAVLCMLTRSATSQYQALPAINQQQHATAKIMYPAAPMHYVNIGPQLAGDYQFGYDTGKGPLGQSFREEMRMADGTVKGTYGIIDEKGQKRIVHYSAGKGGFIAEEDAKIPNSAYMPTHRKPKFLMDQGIKLQLPVFKPSNYLQARTIRPLYTAAVAQPVGTQKETSTPLQKDTQFEIPIYNLQTLSQNTAVPFPTGPRVQQFIQQFRPEKNDGTMLESPDMAPTPSQVFKPKRVTKKPTIFRKQKKEQKNRKNIEIQSYNPRIEDDYYDSAPGFIDIERLSYNIGADRSSASL